MIAFLVIKFSLVLKVISFSKITLTYFVRMLANIDSIPADGDVLIMLANESRLRLNCPGNAVNVEEGWWRGIE